MPGMKAIAIDRNGGPDVLTLHDVATPQPKPGEARVRLEASGINYIDVYFRTGAYPAPHFPFVLGQEGAGVVESVGDGVTSLRIGDRVAYAGTPGSYAEYACVTAEKLVRVPNGVSSNDAAALMLQGMTAHYLLNSTYPVAAGETILVHAGAGGVGLLLTQLAKAKGATVITTVSTEAKAELSKRAGADHVIRYDTDDFAVKTREFTSGKGSRSCTTRSARRRGRRVSIRCDRVATSCCSAHRADPCRRSNSRRSTVRDRSS